MLIFSPNRSDLFDDEGFSLCDINRTLLGEEVIQQQDDVYFLDSGCDSDDESAKMKSKKLEKDKNGREELSMEEEINLQGARVRNDH